MRRTVIFAGLILVCLVGCTHMKPASSSTTPDGTVATPAQTAVAAPEVQPAEPPPSAAAPVDRIAEAPALPSKTTPPGSAPVNLKPHSTTNISVKPSAAVASATPPSKQAIIATAPAPEKPPAQPTLDLASLEQRLRDTHAIGVFTKLSLKNQVDDLLDQFRSFYRGEGKTSLPDLRQRYNLLLLKVLSLLQDGDAQLAAMISSSREAIWGILADPEKFAKI